MWKALCRIYQSLSDISLNHKQLLNDTDILSAKSLNIQMDVLKVEVEALCDSCFSVWKKECFVTSKLLLYRRSKAKTFSFVMSLCLDFACSNKSGKLNETKKFFKVPDPKKNCESCSQWLHNIGNAKWIINNF